MKKVSNKLTILSNKIFTQHNLREQLPTNIIANLVFFLINIIIGMLLVPFFINNLGIASYAIIPLATSITSYVALVTQSLNSSVSRFMIIELQRKEYEKANITFNTSLVGILGIVLILVPVAFTISRGIPAYFQIPLIQRYDVFLLFLGVIGSFFISTIGSVFGTSLFAYNRIDLQRSIQISATIVKVGLIILFFSAYTPRLSYVGLSILISSLIHFILTLILSKKVNPHYKINCTYFKLSKLKEIVETSNWLVISQIGALLFLQIDLIIVNKIFGSIAGGEYAIILTLGTLLRTFAGLFAGVLTPVILTFYAMNKLDSITSFSKSAVKFMGFTIALPIGIILGFAPQILSLWVGSEFVKLVPLMWILLPHLIINLAVLPLFSINLSYNKVRIPGLVTLFMGIGNFVLAITLAYITDWGYYSVAVAGCIMLTIKNSLFIPWYATKVAGLPKYTFIRPILAGIMYMVLVVGIINAFNLFFDISTLIPLIIICIFTTVIYLSLIWFISLNQWEREIIKSFIPRTEKDICVQT